MTVLVPDLNEEDQRKINLTIQQIAAGRSNAVGIVTLTAGATSTTVNDLNCAAGSVIRLDPRTANAAAAIPTTYTATANKSFTIFHANAATVDRTFAYAIQG